MPSSFTQSGRRLGFAVLFFVLCTILVVTLEPFDFRVPSRLHPMWWDGWFDVVTNVALFVVPGFLFSLSRQAANGEAGPLANRRRTMRDALIYGAIFSALIETTQAFEPSRYPSPTDVLSNTTGAWLGAWVFVRISRLLRSDTPLIGMFALELPLMGLVYLLVPLCTLAALTLPHSHFAPVHLAFSWRECGLVALGCFGGVLVGHVQRYHFGARALIRPWQSAVAAAGLYTLGTIPAWPTNPMVVVVGTCLTACVAWSIGGLGVSTTVRADRRFEAAALRRGAPFFLCYLGLATMGDPSFTGPQLSRVQIIGHVESFAAFTVFGYLLAEGWGRLELRYRWVVAYVAVACLAIAFAILRSRHAAPFSPSEHLALALHSVAGAYGGWIYHLQRAHIRSLVTAQRMAKGERSTLTEKALSTAA